MTVTSNIHYNLSSWTSTTYSLGNRVYTGSVGSGNTYQCTTAGSSTSAPTGTGTGINNGGAAVWKWLSAYDYADAQSWASAVPTGTLTQPYVGQMWNNGLISVLLTSQFAIWLNFTGHTATSSNTITLTTAPGESFRDTLAGQATACAWSSTTGVSVQFQVGNGSTTNYQSNYIMITNDAYVYINNIQFQDLNSTGQCTMLANNGTGLLGINDCIFDGYSQNTGPASMFETPGAPVVMTNCLWIERQVATDTEVMFVVGSGSSPAVNGSKIINCTFYAVNSGKGGAAILQGGSGGTAVLTMTNCIIIGWTLAAQTSAGTYNASYSLTDNSSFAISITSGSGNLYSKTASNQFVTVGTDFRLKSTADAKDAGTTDSTDIPTTDDIARTTRPQGSAWDIGMWEYMAAVVGLPLTIWLD